MNFGNAPESKNFVDQTAEPWYSPNKLMAAINIGFHRAIRDPKQLKIDQHQAALDANPVPKMTSQQVVDNLHARVTRQNGGWNVKTPNAIVDSFIPSVVRTPYSATDAKRSKAVDNSGLRPEEMEAIEKVFRKLHKQ